MWKSDSPGGRIQIINLEPDDERLRHIPSQHKTNIMIQREISILAMTKNNHRQKICGRVSDFEHGTRSWEGTKLKCDAVVLKKPCGWVMELLTSASPYDQR